MQTQTHFILALALFGKPKNRLRNWAALCGAMATDAFIYISFAWCVGVLGQSPHRFFSDTYYQAPTQFWGSLSNSIPLYAALALLALLIKSKPWRAAALVFALAGLTQAAIDFPIHADDAHAHFWPLTSWRFYSPLSYWDPQHYSHIVAPLEHGLGLICIAVLWRKFSQRPAQAQTGARSGLMLAWRNGPKLWAKVILVLLTAYYIIASVLIGLSLLASA